MDMDEETYRRLLWELREQINTLFSANHLLTTLVRERGVQRDLDCLAMSDQALYRLMRTIQHLEFVHGSTPILQSQLIDVAQPCRRLGESLEHIAADLKVDFSWSVDSGDYSTMADPLLLEQALLNLLTNAIQAAGEGGKVWLRAALSGGSILLTVEDNGPGMGADPQLSATSWADPFLKTPGGVGLGMDMVKKIARLHKGTVMWHDRAGGGLSVTLSLPQTPPSQPSEIVKTPLRSDLTGGFPLLLVELSPLLPLEQFMPENLD